MRQFQRSAWELPVLKRLFPTIARITADWPPEKWIMAPFVLVFAILTAGFFVRELTTDMVDFIVRWMMSRSIGS